MWDRTDLIPEGNWKGDLVCPRGRRTGDYSQRRGFRLIPDVELEGSFSIENGINQKVTVSVVIRNFRVEAGEGMFRKI